MRLTKTEQDNILTAGKKVFGEAEIYLFGSRVDDQQKGGDIDLYLIPDNRDELYEKKIKFLVELTKSIGEQKIDVIIAKDADRLIEQEALKKGIKL